MPIHFRLAEALAWSRFLHVPGNVHQFRGPACVYCNQQHQHQQHEQRQPQPQQQQQQQQQQQHRSYSSRPLLQDILKLQLLQGKTADEVENIWMMHHEGSASHVGSVMSAAEAGVLTPRAKASPLFVLPLRKPPQGFCTLMVQWQQQQALVTTLEEYKQAGPRAPAHFVMSLFDELAASHGLVLLCGTLNNENLVNKAEGRTIMELLRALYTDPTGHSMVYTFNHQPEQFSFEDLLSKLQISN